MSTSWLRLSIVAVLAAWLAGGTAPAAEAADRPARDLRVITYNQYLGADLTPLLTAPPAQFNGALVSVLKQVAENRFPARVRRQAALLARAGADLIGLQEVWRFRCQDLPPVAGACASPAIRGAFRDHLPLTLAALRAAGARYEVAAVVRNFDTADIVLPIDGGALRGLPFSVNGKNGLVLAQDRDVILVRTGIFTQPVSFADCRASADGCLFDTTLVVPIPALPGVSVDFKRGFVAVDADVRGRRYRFVNTHLEVEQPEPGNPASMFFQSAQAAQLIDVLSAQPMHGRELVLVGDLNSAPSDVSPAPGIVPPYQAFAAAGWIDTWRLARRTPGFTCCQAADLRNVPSELFKRIDFVLAGTAPVTVPATYRIGEALGDRTPGPVRPRLWPSDHAGVVADLRF